MTTAASVYELVDARTAEILERRRAARGFKGRGWLVRRALLTADLLGLSCAFFAAELLFRRNSGAGVDHVGQSAEYVLLLLSLPVWVFAAKLYGLYDRDEERTDHSTADEFAGVFHLVTVISWLLFATSRLTSVAHPEYQKLVTFWIVAAAGIPLMRALARSYCRRRIEYLQNTVIVGAGEVGQALAVKILRHPEYGINLVGFVDADPVARRKELAHLAHLGEPSDLPQVVRVLDVERVIFAFSSEPHEETLQMIRKLNELGVQADIVPRFFDVIHSGVYAHAVEGFPVFSLPPSRLARSSRLLKRMLDLLGACVGLLVLSPLFGVAAVAIKLDSRGPVFFRQVRAGQRGAPFRIWKFRTMSADAEERKDDLRQLNMHARPGGDPRMFKMPEDPRTTRVGKLLRRSSIDELPQLVNVLTGQMSLVGPRPLILEEHEHVGDWRRRRLDLKPGMTGLWQVLGRNEIPFEEMVRLDYLYVTRWSLPGDLRLIVQTLPALRRGGV